MSARTDNREFLGGGSPTESPSLVAHGSGDGPRFEIVPAARWREWMDEAESRWPNRCLPLLMANESGWWLLNPHAFCAEWDGGNGPSSVSIAYDRQLAAGARLAISHFGYGIVTWSIPYLFSTDPGWELLVRGPANLPKDGATALEGLVETDWATASFTMSWKLTRQDQPVRFEAGEPFCMLVPQRRHDLEAIVPRTTALGDNPELCAGYLEWQRRRDRAQVLKFVSEYGKVDGFDLDSWEKDYFKGRRADGTEAPEHRTKRKLRAFEPAGASPGE